ncbi:MAG: sulfatase family protein [Planctomycetota bacterium]
MLRHMILAVTAGACLVGRPALAEDTAAPNVVVIFTDDQGYGDVGVFGATGFTTPNIDRMAGEGMRFTSFYVAQPVCSASRAALLTGCYPNRIGFAGALGPRSKIGLAAEETTLGELCRSKGYATAVYGKWHLGHHEPFLPVHHGFDEYYGTPYSNDMWPWHPAYAHLPDAAAKRKRGYPDLPLIEGDSIADAEVTGDDQKQFTHDFTERAVEFIKAHKDQRFLVYLAHPMPHVPLFTSDAFAGSSEQGAYGDVIQEIDWSVGRVLETLEELGLDENTLVIFTSDNGPWLSYGNHAGSTGPLREGKGSTWEGGVRVPCVMRWPGRIPADTVCDEPVMTIDVFPTVAGLIGAELPERRIDGKDIWPLMAGTEGAESPHDALLFYYRRNDLEAIRSGRWKLMLPHSYRSLTGEPGNDGSPNGYTQVPCGLELYDLEADISETTDLAAARPDVVERLMKHVEAARADLGDALTNRSGSGIREPGKIVDE